ncbi:MAG: 6-pyruvoyl tetrahydropterin synthase family protein [Planctomycetota bacterium]|nr:6-pyruvoyl tetrahydropterin synthase family protein [Planctomycetota bacterium]
MKETYCIDIHKEEFTFSAAHFITFNDNICERLHGHNYGVRCHLESTLDQNQYVYDFIAVRDALSEICSQLDHHMLLPDSHPMIQVKENNNEVEVTFEDRRWVFPLGDCRILPMQNTTVELIARYIGLKLIEMLTTKGFKMPSSLEIGVDENNGQWGVWKCNGEHAN